LDDVQHWWRVVYEPLTPVVQEADFLAEAAALLPPAPWTADSWGAWTQAIKVKTGRKGKELFMPLRLALTAAEHGPEMKLLLPMMDEACVKNRLSAQTA